MSFYIWTALSLSILIMQASCGRMLKNEDIVDYSVLNHPIDPDALQMNLQKDAIVQSFALLATKGSKSQDDKDGALFFSKSIEFLVPGRIPVKSGTFKPRSTLTFSFVNVGDLSNLKQFLRETLKEPTILSNAKAYSCRFTLPENSQFFQMETCESNGFTIYPGLPMFANLVYLHVDSRGGSHNEGEVQADIVRVPEDQHEGLTPEQSKAMDTIPSYEPAIGTVMSLPSGSTFKWGSTEIVPLGTTFLHLDLESTSIGRVSARDRLLISMTDVARTLAERPKWTFPSEGKKKPAQVGLAYGLGLKDHTGRKVPLGCPESIHGLDCSGFIRQLALQSGINIPVLNAAALQTPEVWNDFLYSKGMRAVRVSLATEFETGEIVGWSSHIGIVKKEQTGIVSIFQSNGAASSQTDCIKNLSLNRGPRSVTVAKITASGFMGPITSRFRIQPIPKMERLSSSLDALSGGKVITIEGDGFTKGTAVFFGAIQAQDVTIESDFRLTVKVPPGQKEGIVLVKIVNTIANSPISDLPSETSLSFEYASQELSVNDFSYKSSDGEALLDLGSSSTKPSIVDVETGKAIYILGTGLTGATFKIPGYSGPLSGTAVNISSTDPLSIAGKQVIRFTIPSGAKDNEVGAITGSKIVNGLTVQSSTTRQIRIKEVSDWEIHRKGYAINPGVGIVVGDFKFSCPERPSTDIYDAYTPVGFVGTVIQKIDGIEEEIVNSNSYGFNFLDSSFCKYFKVASFTNNYSDTIVSAEMLNSHTWKRKSRYKYGDYSTDQVETAFYDETWNVEGYIKQTKRLDGKCDRIVYRQKCVTFNSTSTGGSNNSGESTYCPYLAVPQTTVQACQARPLQSDFFELWKPQEGLYLMQPDYSGNPVTIEPVTMQPLN